jgi:hypothetical protein
MLFGDARMARGRVRLALRRFAGWVGGGLWKGAGAVSTRLVNQGPALILPALATVIGGPPLMLIVLALFVAYRVAKRFTRLGRHAAVIERTTRHLSLGAMVVFLGVQAAIFFPTEFNLLLLLVNLVLLAVMRLMNTRKSASIALIVTILLVWTVSLGFFLVRLTWLEAWLANVGLVAVAAAMLSVIAACIDILVHRKAIEPLVASRRNAWASSMCVLVATQAYGFGLTYDTAGVDAILAQDGVHKIATYEGNSEFRSRTQIRVNLASETCRKDRYLVGYFMDSGLPPVAYDWGSEVVVTLPGLSGDSSETYVAFCDRNQYLMGAGNRLVLLQDWFGEFVVRDEVVFEGVGNYVYRIDTNPVTGQNHVNVWDRARSGVAFEVSVVDDRLVLGDRIDAMMTIHDGDASFRMTDSDLVRLDDGVVVAQAPIGAVPKYTHLAFSPRNRSLFLIDLVGSAFGKLDVLDADTLVRKRTFNLDKGIRFLAYNDKHDVLVVANTLNGNLFVLEGVTGNVLKTLKFSYRLRTIQFSEDRDRAFVTCAAGLYAIDLAKVVEVARRPPAIPMPGPPGQPIGRPRALP